LGKLVNLGLDFDSKTTQTNLSAIVLEDAD